MSKPKLFYSPGACSLASHIAIEETGIEFEPVLVKFADAEQRRPEYLKMNPKGRVPVYADGDLIVTENPAILHYLAQTYPQARLWPKGGREQARCMEWLAWLCSGVHATYSHIPRPERYATSDEAKANVVATGKLRCAEVWPMVEAKLGQGPWAVGEQYTVADPYLFVFWLWGRGPRLGFDMAKDYPNWTAHAQAIAARPAARRVLAREGIDAPA